MSEFIREVDEEYRQEQIRSLLGRYWVAILALAIAILVVAGGWRGYVYYLQQQAETAGSQYFDATEVFASDKAGSLAALDTLSRDGPAGYRMLARFRAAAELGVTDAPAAVKAFDALGQDKGLDQNLRDIAKVRAALLVMGSADPVEISRRFEPLADANAPFRNLAREMLAVTALKQGDDVSAKRWLDAEIADPTTVQDQRQRAGVFLGLIRAGKPGESIPSPAPAPTGLAPPPPAMLDPAPMADRPALVPATPAPSMVSPTPDAPAVAPPMPDQPQGAKP